MLNAIEIRREKKPGIVACVARFLATVVGVKNLYKVTTRDGGLIGLIAANSRKQAVKKGALQCSRN